MKLDAKESLIAWIALTLTDKIGNDGKPQSKTYGLAQLDIASGAIKKLREANIVNGDQISFKPESEVEFTTDEKKMIKDNIGLREWSANDGEAVLSLKAKTE